MSTKEPIGAEDTLMSIHLVRCNFRALPLQLHDQTIDADALRICQAVSL